MSGIKHYDFHKSNNSFSFWTGTTDIRIDYWLILYEQFVESWKQPPQSVATIEMKCWKSESSINHSTKRREQYTHWMFVWWLNKNKNITLICTQTLMSFIQPIKTDFWENNDKVCCKKIDRHNEYVTVWVNANSFRISSFEINLFLELLMRNAYVQLHQFAMRMSVRWSKLRGYSMEESCV